MRMTLFVDSSFDDKVDAGGWGSWAIRDDWGRGRFQGGPIILRNNRIANSTVAELSGIALALWTHGKAGDLDAVVSILIQCDNVGALSLISKHIPRTRIVPDRRVQIGRAKSSHPDVPIMLDTIDNLLRGKGVSVKHVKGHTDNNDGRSWVNRHCDAEARRYMLARRKELRAQS